MAPSARADSSVLRMDRRRSKKCCSLESNSERSRFRYVVWNHTNPKFRNVAYAVGEFVRTQPAPNKTIVTWTYRFALKGGLSAEEKSRFQKIFLEQEFAAWMRTQMDRKPSDAEPVPPVK